MVLATLLIGARRVAAMSTTSGFMAIKLFGNINTGLIVGLLQFVSTFAITGWYVRYADRRLDPLGGKIRTEIEGGDR
nr:DUF485 domain-containing protein [Pseudonocardia asaccharolytica]